MMTTSILDYLYATPYTPIAPSDRSGDLLGWSRLRQKLQRELFPAFTVLTPRRTSAEMLLLYLKILNDQSLRAGGTFKNLKTRQIIRHLEVLFGMASLVTDETKSFHDLLELEDKNPYGILNIERIQNYLKQNLHEPEQTSRKNTVQRLHVSEEYLTNLSYGIAPHYSASLRRFGLINDKNQIRDLKPEIIPVNNGNTFKSIRPIINQWFDKNKGIEFKNLERLNKITWLTLKENYGHRTDFWLDFIRDSTSLKETLFPYLCSYVVNAKLKVRSPQAFKREIYLTVFGHEPYVPDALRDCLEKCRTFEVVTSLADFLLYLLIAFADKSVSNEARLPDFVDQNKKWLPQVVRHLQCAISRARELELLEPNDFRDWPDETVTPEEMIHKALHSIIDQHLRKKGSMAFLQREPLDNRDVLARTNREQGGLGDAEAIQEKLRHSVVLPKLINNNNVTDLFDHDQLWATFIDRNFLWETFGKWFGCIEDDKNKQEASNV